MKKQVARISILQSSKIFTALHALLGCVYALIGILFILFGSEALKIMGIIYCAMPLLMAILAFIFFVIGAGLYNLLAKWLGGIEVEIRDVATIPEKL